NPWFPRWPPPFSSRGLKPRGLPPGKGRLRPRDYPTEGRPRYPVTVLGVWRSLVARSVRVGEVPSSNLGTPIERRHMFDTVPPHFSRYRCLFSQQRRETRERR